MRNNLHKQFFCLFLNLWFRRYSMCISCESVTRFRWIQYTRVKLFRKPHLQWESEGQPTDQPNKDQLLISDYDHNEEEMKKNVILTTSWNTDLLTFVSIDQGCKGFRRLSTVLLVKLFNVGRQKYMKLKTIAAQANFELLACYLYLSQLKSSDVNMHCFYVEILGVISGNRVIYCVVNEIDQYA